MMVGPLLPASQAGRILRLGTAGAGLALVVFVVVAGLLGPQDGSRNPANYLTWLYFWPGVAILVALVGDVWRYLDPWTTLGALMGADRAAITAARVWPGVTAFAGFVWVDLASGLSNRPRDLAVAVLVLSAFVLVPVPLAGARWLVGAEPFALVFGAIGRNSLSSVLRSRADPSDEPSAGWDRFTLHVLFLSAAIFDALIATPQWSTLAAAVGGGTGQERGGLGFVVTRTSALAITGLAAGALILGAAVVVDSRARLARTATRLALVTLPVAVTLMAAHNLPALLRLGPRLPEVLGAFLTGGAAAAGTSPDMPVVVTLASPLWAAEVVLMVLGFVWSAWLAWRDLGPAGASSFDRIATAYPAWAMLMLTSVVAVLILYEPAAALTP